MKITFKNIVFFVENTYSIVEKNSLNNECSFFLKK